MKNNVTILNLPNSVKLVVDEIDYRYQLIRVHESDNCFVNQIHGLNFTASVFKYEYYLSNFSLFNCSTFIPMRGAGTEISCLSGPGYNVIAVASDNFIEYADLMSCTKLYDISSVPYDVFYTNITWSWSRPDCRKCESKGTLCGSTRTGDRTRIQCFNATTLQMINDESTGRASVIAGAVVGGVVLLGLVIFVIHLCRKHCSWRTYEEMET